MSIWSKITGQFIDVIEWTTDDREVLIAKFPDKDKEVKMGAQLTVRPGQAAIFVNEGKLADVFTEGRYELTTRNMPIMTTLRSWKYGFNSPFKVDIYFVNLQEFSGLKWGTPNPIQFFDPHYSLVELRAFGSITFRVQDAAKFFTKFAGTDSEVTLSEFAPHFRDVIVEEFSKGLKRSGQSLAEIIVNAQELGTMLTPILQSEFDRVGIQILRFSIANVSIPEELEKQIKEEERELRMKRRTMSIDNEAQMQRMMNEFQIKMSEANLSQNIADMDKYVRFQMGQGMTIPGTGGGEMSDMMRTMMQMQMMQQMMGGQNPGQTFAPPPSSAPPQNPAPASSAPMTREQIMATLKELGELKTSGIISDAEFEAKKQELLARL
jgi:membrane protease subunit (stomatin/prohibitin family)